MRSKQMLLVGLLCCASLLLGLFAMSTGYDFAKDFRTDQRVGEVLARFDRVAQHLPLVGELVDDLPQDEHQWWLTIFEPAEKCGKCQQIEGWFQTDPQLAKLRSQTRFQIIDTSQKKYQLNATAIGDQLPAVTLQKPNGQLCYKASGGNLPITSVALSSEMAESIGRCRPPKPKPSPSPAPVVQPRVPDMRPSTPITTTGDSKLLTLLVVIGVPLLVGAIAVVAEMKDRIRD